MASPWLTSPRTPDLSPQRDLSRGDAPATAVDRARGGQTQLRTTGAGTAGGWSQSRGRITTIGPTAPTGRANVHGVQAAAASASRRRATISHTAKSADAQTARTAIGRTCWSAGK